MSEEKRIAITFERRADNVGVLWIDIPGAAQNTLDARLQDELDGALNVARKEGVTALVVASKKKDSFIAGADIEMISECRSASAATALSRSGQLAFDRIEMFALPIVAAIDGPCLGGGLELALACHGRIASTSPKTRLGLPEVQLGLLPGAGGTQRLPELVGVEKALDLLLSGKRLDAQRAARMGLVDEAVPPSILLEVAAHRALELARERTGALSKVTSIGDRVADFTESLGEFADSKNLRELVLAKNPAGRKLVFDQAEKQIRAKGGDHYPAPFAILEAVKVGLEKGRKAGLAAEAEAFGQLAVTPVSRRLAEIFFATTALKKDMGTRKDGVEPSPVEKVGVLGAGIMGHGIALVTAEKAGLRVRMRDINDRSLGRGLAAIRKVLDAKVDKRRLRPGARDRLMNQITGTTDFSGFAGCDVVVEAIFEDLGVKREVLAKIEEVCPEDTVFGSNTSSIPISAIAEGARHPERVVGMHYFSPVHKMPLLEIIRTADTSDKAVATAVALGKRQGKTVIVVNDGVGFYTSRILGPYLNEAAWMLSEGIPIEAVDGAARAFGFPVGPIALLDEVGLDTAEKVTQITYAEFGERFAPPPGIDRLVADGRTGRKGGRGFYTYGKGEKTVDPSVYKTLGVSPDRKQKYAHDQIGERLALAMVGEAIRCLSDGILRAPRDGDIGAIFGLGFPPFTGGPFRHADAVGPAKLLERIQILADRHGARFAPPQLLVDRARSGHRFYDR